MTGNNSSFQRSATASSACGWSGPSQLERHDVRYFDLATYPLFLVACSVGNAMNAAILARERPVCTKNLYLLGIALTDVLYMWSALFSYISNYDGEIHGRPRQAIAEDIARISGAMYFLQETSGVISSWLIVAFTVERFVAIKYPLKHLVANTSTRRSVLVIVGVVVMACIWCSHRIVDYYWFYLTYPGFGPAPARPVLLYRWNQVYTWGMIVIQITTFLTILILNVTLLYVIFHQQQCQQKELQASAENSEIPTRPERTALVLLNSCVILYLLTQWPIFLYSIMHLIEKACVLQIGMDVKKVILPVTNVLRNTNFSTNFLVYCGADYKFRARVCKLCNTGRDSPTRRQSKLSERSNILSSLNSPDEVDRLNIGPMQPSGAFCTRERLPSESGRSLLRV